MPNRRGTSLIELVVVISVMSLITMISVTTIWALMQAEGGSAEALWRSTTLSRLARTFRRDVRAAISAEVARGTGNKPDRLSLELPGGRLVVYETGEKQVKRSSRDGRQSQQIETFRLPGGETRFESRTQGAMLGLVHARRRVAGDKTTTTTATTARELKIWAAVGRDHRFRKQAEDDSQR